MESEDKKITSKTFVKEDKLAIAIEAYLENPANNVFEIEDIGAKLRIIEAEKKVEGMVSLFRRTYKGVEYCMCFM